MSHPTQGHHHHPFHIHKDEDPVHGLHDNMDESVKGFADAEVGNRYYHNGNGYIRVWPEQSANQMKKLQKEGEKEEDNVPLAGESVTNPKKHKISNFFHNFGHKNNENRNPDKIKYSVSSDEVGFGYKLKSKLKRMRKH